MAGLTAGPRSFSSGESWQIVSAHNEVFGAKSSARLAAKLNTRQKGKVASRVDMLPVGFKKPVLSCQRITLFLGHGVVVPAIGGIENARIPSLASLHLSQLLKDVSAAPRLMNFPASFATRRLRVAIPSCPATPFPISCTFHPCKLRLAKPAYTGVHLEARNNQ